MATDPDAEPNSPTRLTEAVSASRRRAVWRQGLAVGSATGLYGVSFGALSTAAGLGFWPTMVLSLALFSGGSQFAFVAVVGSGGSPLVAVASSTLLGLRNGLYGVQVARWLDVTGPRRLIAAQLTIDESTAVGLAQPEPAARRLGFWVTGAAVYLGWNLMTAAGALAGDALGDPKRYGLDAVAAAAFVALLWPRLAASGSRVVALVAAVLATACVPVLPAGVPVLAGAAVAVLWPVATRRRPADPARGAG
jgi:predicted branched-subunit amino acid permease